MVAVAVVEAEGMTEACSEVLPADWAAEDSAAVSSIERDQTGSLKGISESSSNNNNNYAMGIPPPSLLSISFYLFFSLFYLLFNLFMLFMSFLYGQLCIVTFFALPFCFFVQPFYSVLNKANYSFSLFCFSFYLLDLATAERGRVFIFFYLGLLYLFICSNFEEKGGGSFS